MSQFKGRKVLIVNVASECGYTPQYAALEEIHQAFGDKVAVIGFPCNDFGGQEPGTAADILQFCDTQYGVSFPLAQKVSIKGAAQHPIYQWLTQKSQNGQADQAVDWNFCKFLLDEQGQWLAFFPSATHPADETILEHIGAI